MVGSGPSSRTGAGSSSSAAAGASAASSALIALSGAAASAARHGRALGGGCLGGGLPRLRRRPRRPRRSGRLGGGRLGDGASATGASAAAATGSGSARGLGLRGLGRGLGDGLDGVRGWVGGRFGGVRRGGGLVGGGHRDGGLWRRFVGGVGRLRLRRGPALLFFGQLMGRSCRGFGPENHERPEQRSSRFRSDQVVRGDRLRGPLLRARSGWLVALQLSCPRGPGESSTRRSDATIGYDRPTVPELPDLTVVAEALHAALAGRPIARREAPAPLAVRGTPAELEALVGQRLTADPPARQVPPARPRPRRGSSSTRC